LFEVRKSFAAKGEAMTNIVEAGESDPVEFECPACGAYAKHPCKGLMQRFLHSDRIEAAKRFDDRARGPRR
jgi:hypothetical protein